LTRRLLLLAIASMLSAPAARAQEAGARVPQEVRELTDFYERRVRQQVQEFLGPQARAVVSVSIDARPIEPGEPNTTVAGVLDSPGTQLLVGPYFPSPAELSAAGASGEIEYRIVSAEVSVQVEPNIAQDQRDQLNGLLTASLKSIPVKISIEASLRANGAIAAAGDDESGRSPASEGSPATLNASDPITRFSQRFGSFVPLAAAFVLLIGIFAVVAGLRAAAKEIGDGIKSVAAAGSMRGAAPRAAAIKAPEASERRALPAGSGGNAPTASEVRRNVQALEHYLAESPSLFLRSLGDVAEDSLGISFMISRMSVESNMALRELLGVERIQRIRSFRASSEIVDFDVNGWLQDLVERIVLRRLSGGDVMEEAMSPEQTALLANAGQDQLLRAARQSGEPAVWRVVSEFLSSDFIRGGDAAADDALWMGLARGARVTDVSEVKEAVNGLVDQLRAASSENAVLIREKNESREHFQRRVLPILVETMLERELGEDDRMVGQVVAEAPEFAELIFERVWTPSRLDQVTDAALKAFVMSASFDNERRAYLLFALPTPQSTRIESFLPEGSMKKIVLDIASRLRTTADAEKKAAIRGWVRDFLDAARVEAAAGRLEMKDEPSSRRASEDAEVVDEAA
jgi:hypothetical protein